MLRRRSSVIVRQLQRHASTAARPGYVGFGSFHGDNVEEMMARAADATEGSWVPPPLPDVVADVAVQQARRLSAPPPYGASTRASEFLLAPEWTFLNHGAFGAACRGAHEAAAAWRLHAERQPLEFIDRQLFAHLVESMRVLGGAIGASPRDLAMVPNATSALNIAVDAACRSANVGEGDEILLLDVGYGSVEKIVRREAVARRGARTTTMRVLEGLPATANPDDLVGRFEESLTPRTKVAIIDHITSNTAIRLPVERLTALCRARGILSIVDAAHSIGSCAAVDVPALGGDFTCANLHKWLCNVRGSALLHVRPTTTPEHGGSGECMLHKAVEPLIVSHGYGAGGLASDFVWQGAGDYAPWLSVTSCLRWWEDVGGLDAAHRHNSALLMAAARTLCDAWSTPALVEPGSLACAPTMALVQLPISHSRRPHTPADGKAAQDYLYSQHIECPVKTVQGRLYVRVSATVYNSLAEYERLAQVVREADWSAVLSRD